MPVNVEENDLTFTDQTAWESEPESGRSNSPGAGSLSDIGGAKFTQTEPLEVHSTSLKLKDDPLMIKNSSRLFHVGMIISLLLLTFILCSTFIIQTLLSEYRSSFCEVTPFRDQALSQDWTTAGHDCISRYGLIMKDPKPCMESILIPTLIQAKPANVQGGFLMFIIIIVLMYTYYTLRGLFGECGESICGAKSMRQSNLMKKMRKTTANVMKHNISFEWTIQRTALLMTAFTIVEIVSQWFSIMSMFGVGVETEPKNVDYIHVLLGSVSMHMISFGLFSTTLWCYFQFKTDSLHGMMNILLLDGIGFIFDLLYLFSNYVVMLKTDCNSFACLIDATQVDNWVDLISTSIPIIFGPLTLINFYGYHKKKQQLLSEPKNFVTIPMIILSIVMIITGITGWAIVEKQISNIHDEWTSDIVLGPQFSKCENTDRLYLQDRAECMLVMIMPRASDEQITKVIDKWKYPKLAVLVTDEWSSGPLDIHFENLRYAKFVIPAHIKAEISSSQAEIKFYNQLSLEPRMKTFHQIDASNGLCLYVDFDRFECNDLSNVLENEEGFVPGPCPSGHTRDHCDSTTQFELDAVAALGKVVYSSYCDFDFDDMTYDFVCEEGSSAPTCPTECADAIAAADKDAEFCSTIQSELKDGKRHDFPAACSDLGDLTLGLCMPELYEKCIEGSDKYICPIPEYGLPPVLKNCEPQNCAEWKEAVDTGCAKDVSACLKDEMQGKLGCTKQGKKLPVSSYASCSKSEACAKSGEFCYFGGTTLFGPDLKTGQCQLCSFNLCEYLTNDKAKDECLEQCTNQDCTADLGCDDTCEREPKTCKQLENAMESVSGCGKTCNQCHIDVYNAKLDCKGGDKVQSRLDGDSANALSVLMLATVAIFLWV